MLDRLYVFRSVCILYACFPCCEHVACTDKMVTATILAQATRSLGIPCGFQLVETCEVPDLITLTLWLVVLLLLWKNKSAHTCTCQHISASGSYPYLRECIHLRVLTFIALIFGLTFSNTQPSWSLYHLVLSLPIYPISHVSWDSLKSYSLHARALCCLSLG